MKIYQVDAFTKRLFHGNPAAVVPMEAFPDDTALQAIAAENNLAETAFFIPRGSGDANFHLRWFTPEVEVDLCGHATLAAAHVLWTEMGFEKEKIVFDGRSGLLTVSKDAEGRVELDFPAKPGEAVEITSTVVRALGREPVEMYRSDDLMCVFDNKRQVHELAPDFALLAGIEARGVIATAPGAGHDFVSRFFAPAVGINEDAVTGSAHCTLTPYWATKLGRDNLTAHQISKRGGELWCTNDRERGRVKISGNAVTYLRGEIHLS